MVAITTPPSNLHMFLDQHERTNGCVVRRRIRSRNVAHFVLRQRQLIECLSLSSLEHLQRFSCCCTGTLIQSTPCHSVHAAILLRYVMRAHERTEILQEDAYTDNSSWRIINVTGSPVGESRLSSSDRCVFVYTRACDVSMNTKWVLFVCAQIPS